MFQMTSIASSYKKHLTEQFLLNSAGVLMDVSAVLKKPSYEFIEYHKQNKLEDDDSILVDGKFVKNSADPSDAKKEDQPDQMVEKARHEAYVVSRVASLRKEGLWPEKKLPKIHEPARTKCHWDYLLEEMVWLSADFKQERKWKKAAAKKCAKMVHKYFQDKELAVERAQKEEELKLKKIASFIAKEVRTFWNNVEKIVHYKMTSKHEEKKKVSNCYIM